MSTVSSIKQARVAKLQSRLTPSQLLLVSSPSDIRYLSNFGFLVPQEREALVLITPTKSYLLRAHFSPAPPDDALIPLVGCLSHHLVAHLQKLAEEHSATELLIDTETLFTQEYLELKSLHGLRLTPDTQHLVRALRAVKDTPEVAALRRAGQIAAETFARVEPQLRTGMTELAVTRLIEETLATLGSEHPAFPTIVAFGPHGALPHHQPTSASLSHETAVLIDFGATFQGYRSDMTRSFWFGEKPSATFTEIQTLVHQAYDAALERLQPRGSAKTLPSAKDIDTAARSIITAGGYAEAFIHTTGHSLGLDIHEQPSLNWKNSQLLEPGMVVTIEPGIYLEGTCGYRYENTVLIAESGPEILTRTKKLS